MLSAPEVTLEIAFHPPSVIEAAVIEGSVDIGIVPIHRHSSALNYHQLYAEQMTLYCGAGHPLFDCELNEVSRTKLAEHKYAGYGFNSPNMVAGQRLSLRRAARVEDEEGLSLLILSGRYLGYLADHVAKPLLEMGKVKPVIPSKTQYESQFAAIVRKRPEIGRTARAFLECLKQAH